MKVFIIGGGASGLMAAIAAAKEGADVTIFEKNEKLGKKIYITGKGRCNLTNDCTEAEFMNHVMRNNKFMYSAYNAWTSQDMQDFLRDNGLKIKTERGGRVFPESDKASDVTKTLEKVARGCGVKVFLSAEVKNILADDKITGIELSDGRKLSADRVIIATGGLSYASTGSTGDGYKWALKTGHEIKDTYPSLVSVKAGLYGGYDISNLAGLSLKNIRLTALKAGKKIYSEFGEMLFTHEGISGPLVLTLSSVISGKYDPKELTLQVDLKPALSSEELDARLIREFDDAKNKTVKNVMRTLLPESMIQAVISQCEGVKPDMPVHEITKEYRQEMGRVLKNFVLQPSALGGYNEAVITRGGVSVKDIDPKTMESKKISGLYFAGEVIDVDATTGGFNLQIAWSTGYAAGKNSALKKEEA